MKLFKLFSLSLTLVTVLTVCAFADPTVTSPYGGSTVSSPFTLTATASSCSSQSITAMGYSLDSSANTVIVTGGYLQQSVSASQGGHTIHVKAWGVSGAVCVTDVSVVVNTSTASSNGPVVNSPISGSSVSSPFTLSAYDSTCSGQPVSAMGYSVDSSTSSSVVYSTTLNASVSSGTGGHTLHVKAWGNAGASCVTDVAVTVSSTALVPSNATTVSNLQSAGLWTATHDSGTPGTSSGWSAIVSSPSRSGSARQFSTSYTDYGGERYKTSFSDNESAHNFVYDAWFYIKDSATGIANLEMDLNQVIGNGWTVIMAFQCDGWSGTWDYTANVGSATSPKDTWVHTGAGCNPKNWGLNTWHHVQIAYYRDDGGYVTYQSIALDGVSQSINKKAFAGFALGWAPTILTNLQVDGGTSYSSGSNIFIDSLNVSYW